MAVEKIDGRTRSAMSPETRIVHARLEAWASWVKSELQALGLPGQTWLSKWMEYGIDGARQHGKPPEMPEDVARTDAAVARLGAIDRTVISTYYLQWAPRETLAKQCHMRIRQFDAVLKRARWRLEYLLIDVVTGNKGV